MHNTRHHNPQALAAPQVGGRLAVGIFVFTLLAFVIESEFTQVRSVSSFFLNLELIVPGYYLVHSSFAIIFPLHLLYLLATTNYTTVSLLRGLSLAISNHLAPGQKSPNYHFPRAKFIRLILGCTLGITCPALLWFAAVSLASVKLFKLQWEARRLLAVVLATLGTIAVVYGGSTAPVEKDPSSGGPPTTTSVGFRPSAPLLGNLLTLVASFGYGLYQVLYKIYAALPSDPEVAADTAYEQIPEDDEPAISVDPDEAVYPPPFGFHPNLLTSLMGLCTALVLWIPVPFLHWSGTEPFRLPPNMLTVLSICGIALSGVVFNAGFMVLLGVWGPIIVSVGNLLTIVLVLISDVLFGAGIEVVTFWSLLGSGVIVMAFGVLAYDMFTKKT
ncbi:hypothetical protein CVT26_008942 [Gymnopilus dilepis]|uniref:EamA domain-containing protein n=1 Tax=Gymnopilus dilepis TaxID=231916 RepID=A0A409YRQ7_9AGAR|nr:hypothetical protein CVT26_008942 [Gymnopilus dilepis]